MKENPRFKIERVAAHYGLPRDTLHNRYYGKTQAAIAKAARPGL